MKRKSFLPFVLALVFLLQIPINVFAERHQERDIPLNIIINNNIVMSDVKPYIKNNRTYVPIRFIAEELGFDVIWNNSSRKVTMTKDNEKVELTIGSNIMNVNGYEYTLDAQAEITDDRTFVPLRAVAEAFKEEVDYSNDYNSVYIGENPTYNKDYNVVYYYENEAPVISTYTVNIVTYTMKVSGDTKRFTTITELVTDVRTDFTNYYTNGVTIYGVEEYTSPKAKISDNELIDSNKTVKNFESKVEKSKQLKDNYYVEQTQDPLVGSWYGVNGYDLYGESYPTDEYFYITSLGNNRYKLERRIILQDDGSECFARQYGTFEPEKGALHVEYSEDSYNKTGIFASEGLYSKEGYYYLENNGTHLSWKKHNNSTHYMDKY